MLGIPLPDSASIDELIDKLVEMGAKLWNLKRRKKRKINKRKIFSRRFRKMRIPE
jgi:hypothetical protein